MLRVGAVNPFTRRPENMSRCRFFPDDVLAFFGQCMNARHVPFSGWFSCPLSCQLFANLPLLAGRRNACPLARRPACPPVQPPACLPTCPFFLFLTNLAALKSTLDSCPHVPPTRATAPVVTLAYHPGLPCVQVHVPRGPAVAKARQVEASQNCGTVWQSLVHSGGLVLPPAQRVHSHPPAYLEHLSLLSHCKGAGE